MFKRRNYTWNDGKSLSLCDRTLIMGILNGTPDSFSDGGKFNTPEAAAAHVTQMIEDGADIIDLGVESADYALSKGAHILNDIWGLHYDPDMAAIAAKYKVPVIIMHNSNDTNYGDIIEDMKAYFFFAVDKALKVGVTPQQIWLDPGIGFFGKTEEQNIEVMQRLGELTAYEYPILLAPSRKGFIGSMLGGLPPEERDEGTVAACITGVFQGVDMVRVHNVKMHKRALAVADGLLRGE